MWTEDELIDGCLKFRQDAQKALYEKYAGVFRAVCRRYITDPHSAEDLLHDCFIKIFMNIKKYNGTGSFEGWMKKVIINTAVDHFRENKTISLNFGIDEADEPADEDTENNGQPEETDKVKAAILSAEFTKEEIIETVNRLPDGFRIVFNMYVFENYQHKEIAEKLNIEVSTSKSQLSRARKLIQKRLLEMCKNRVGMIS